MHTMLSTISNCWWCLTLVCLFGVHVLPCLVALVGTLAQIDAFIYGCIQGLARRMPHVQQAQPLCCTAADRAWHVCVPHMDIMGVDELYMASAHENDCSVVSSRAGVCHVLMWLWQLVRLGI